MTGADIEALARATLDMDNKTAWLDLRRLINGRVPGAAYTAVRGRVWELRAALLRERKAAAVVAAEDSGG